MPMRQQPLLKSKEVEFYSQERYDEENILLNFDGALAKFKTRKQENFY